MTDVSASAHASFRPSMLIYDRRYRSLTFQVIVFILVMAALWWLIGNTISNLNAMGKSFDFGFLLQHGGDRRGDGDHVRDEVACRLFGDGAATAAEIERQQQQCRELRGERLRRGDADFRSGMRVQHRVGAPRDARVDDVADGE